MTPTECKFIDAAARTVFVRSFVAYVCALECTFCNGRFDIHTLSGGGEGWKPHSPGEALNEHHQAWHVYTCFAQSGVDGAERYMSNRFGSFQIQRRVPDAARLTAAMFLGALTQANGCTLEEIVEAASKADCTPQLGPPHEHDVTCYRVDIAEFARISILEAIGAGVSWFDEHERFEVPKRWRVDINRRSASISDWHYELTFDGKFIVPRAQLSIETAVA